MATISDDDDIEVDGNLWGKVWQWFGEHDGGNFIGPKEIKLGTASYREYKRQGELGDEA